MWRRRIVMFWFWLGAFIAGFAVGFFVAVRYIV
jgi:hypothetical protein